MSKDITYEYQDIKFNYRIGIVIKNGNKILLQKNKSMSHYTLVGGRCNLNESSVLAGIREFKEETGLDIKYIKTLGIVENFFISSFDKKKYHEILIINEYVLKDINNIDIHNIEGKIDLEYTWLDKNNLDDINLKPAILKNIVNNKEAKHYIFKDT